MALVERQAVFLGDCPTLCKRHVKLTGNFAGGSRGFFQHPHVIEPGFVGWEELLFRKQHLVCETQRPMKARNQRPMEGIIAERRRHRARLDFPIPASYDGMAGAMVRDRKSVV